MKLNAYPPPEGIDSADKLMDELIAIDAASPMGVQAKGIKERIVSMRAQRAAQKEKAD
jgi:hypothetical protein